MPFGRWHTDHSKNAYGHGAYFGARLKVSKRYCCIPPLELVQSGAPPASSVAFMVLLTGADRTRGDSRDVRPEVIPASKIFRRYDTFCDRQPPDIYVATAKQEGFH